MNLTALHPPARKRAIETSIPSRSWAARKVADLLAAADIHINGSRQWDITVHDERFFRRLLIEGINGLGDAYLDGWWDCDALDQFFDRALGADLPDRMPFDRFALAAYVKQKLWNCQNRSRARRNVETHYHLGNDVFDATLDPRMLYTCGYWKDARTLDDAQEAKLELVCRKLGLRAGRRVLDIGSGWGSFAKYAAERNGAQVVGITISSEQVKLAADACRGLSVEVRLQDYRDANEPFDHIVSMGCLEHVGPKNHRDFMRTIHRCLTDEGLCLLQFFAARSSFPNLRDAEAVWMGRHIFPGLVVPSLNQIAAAIDGLLVLEDLHNFGAHYDPTLMAWFGNFDAAWPRLRDRYGERFYRMWKYYLLGCAGAFRCRKYQLWQVVLSKHGVRGGYVSVR